MIVESVKGSSRLFSITQAVNADLLQEINTIDWFSVPYGMDDHSRNSETFRRRILPQWSDLYGRIEREINRSVPLINALSGQNYRYVGGTWQICEPDFYCPIHTDGHKPNVMIIYWQTPGTGFGTTFYNSRDTTDVFHEFPSVPNTGFFANYEPGLGESWPEMWHASSQPVPKNGYRLLTQFEFQR